MRRAEEILLRPNDKDAKDYIFINGKSIPPEGQIIKSRDRIIFGTNTILFI